MLGPKRRRHGIKIIQRLNIDPAVRDRKDQIGVAKAHFRQNLDLRGRIHVVGHVSSQSRAWLLANATALLYPTSAEGFGFVPYEAAAMGTPTVFTDFGPLLENHPIFPERANISLAQVTGPDSMILRVWERGAGLTRAWTDSGPLASASAYDVGTRIAYTQPLLAGGWRAVNLSSLIASRQTAIRSRLALRASALDLIRDAEIAYWSLAGARTLVALRETSLRSAESLLAQIRARRALGDATVLEELQAEADVSSQRVAVLNSRQSLDGAEMNLRRLLGQGDAAAVEQALLVAEMPTAAVPAPQTFASWVRTVADFDFGTAIQLANIAQAEAGVA